MVRMLAEHLTYQASDQWSELVVIKIRPEKHHLAGMFALDFVVLQGKMEVSMQVA